MNGRYTIAAYLRLSLEDDDIKDESNSISNQRLLLREYVISSHELRNGNMIEYQDDGYSGTNFDRPGIKRLLEDVKAGTINCIIVKDFSRFARDYIELGSYLDQIFPFMGVRFISVNDSYDSVSHIGKTVGIDTQFKTLLYDFYSKDLSDKYKNAVMSKCEQGQYVFGRCPLGYEKIPGTKHEIRINEYEGNIVKRIFREAIIGKSTSAIAKGLHDDGIPTFTAIRGMKRKADNRETIWQGATVDKILNNRFYIGEWTYNKVKVTSVGSKKLVKRPAEEWKVVPNHHERLVSIEDFDKAQESLCRNKKNNISNKRKRKKHPLIGNVFCGGCGYALTYKQEYHHGCFRCNYSLANRKESCCGGFHAAVLEELILTMLNKELIRLAEFSLLLESQKQDIKVQLSKEKAELRKYEKSLSEKEKEKQARYMDYVKGDISAEIFKQESKLIDKMCSDLSVKIENINDKIGELMGEYHRDYKDMKEMLRYSGIQKLTQEVADLFIDKIYLYDGKRVEVKWSFNGI